MGPSQPDWAHVRRIFVSRVTLGWKGQHCAPVSSNMLSKKQLVKLLFVVIHGCLWTCCWSFTSFASRTRCQTRPIEATSSSEERQRRGTVIQRLQAAAKAANKQKKKLEGLEKVKQQANSPRPSTEAPQLSSLRDLQASIDHRLELQSKVGFRNANQPARDTIIAITNHNQQQKTTDETRYVAVVLGKPLRDDLITVEYANRIRTLVKTMKDEKEPYDPHVICFVGGLSANNRVADADAGYLYFRHLAKAQGVDVSTTTVIDLQRTAIEEGALNHIALFLQQVCLPVWGEGGWVNLNKFDEFHSPPKKRLPVHFTFFSSEYHLAQLFDIHQRSPNQSPLRILEAWSKNTVQVSWSFCFANTPIMDESQPAKSFLAKHFQTSQQLLPVLMNLRGVVENREFFQRDNYRVLVSCRRSLVKDMEELYHRQPSLQAVHKISADGRPLDTVLEKTLLCLGRCLDVVRPAGLLTGSVSIEDWRLALLQMEQAYNLISQACDVDIPLNPCEWGKLEDKDNPIIVLEDTEPPMMLLSSTNGQAPKSNK